MEKTWRWFGKNDKITLSMLKQIGVEGIVTALHDVPNGEVWTREKIRDLREYIESYGMRWSVVESLPVCESIKYAGPDRDQLIENYKESLKNLGLEGVHTICYNFMPVLDWARTDLAHPNPDGTSNLYFSHAQFAYFDCCILKREGAEKDYSPEVMAETTSAWSRATTPRSARTPRKRGLLAHSSASCLLLRASERAPSSRWISSRYSLIWARSGPRTSPRRSAT